VTRNGKDAVKIPALIEWVKRIARPWRRVEDLPDEIRIEVNTIEEKAGRVPSRAMQEAFMISSTEVSFICQCGKTWIAERSLRGAMLDSVLEHRAQWVEKDFDFLPVDVLNLGIWRGEPYVVGCRCVFEDMLEVEDFLKGNHQQCLEYLTYGSEENFPRR